MERYYTVAEVSAITCIPRRTVYAAMSAGRLAYVTPNGCKRGRRVRASDVDAWLECTREGPLGKGGPQRERPDQGR